MSGMPRIPNCERCGKRLVTVTLGDVTDGVRENYKICSDCWTSLCDACPRSNKTDEDAMANWVLDRLRDERILKNTNSGGGAPAK
ncbi:MAG: hypothetical protein HY286_11930 [Planctomycetes bacterium]|nr:hypothetical protein [Planctomycetota bacterium]